VGILNKERKKFHVDYGPASLFERVRFKFGDVRSLKLHGSHYNQRVTDRNIPPELIAELVNFNPDRWELKQAEVRADNGKFILTTWERKFNGEIFWVVVGLGDVVVSVIRKQLTRNVGTTGIITSGSFYDFVSDVNMKLMEDEAAT
jgi:predicted phosphodiesterase